MRLALKLGLTASLVIFGLAQAATGLQRERVVLLLRHGIRPPTHEPALPVAVAPEAWPVWSTPNGELTPHGAQAIRLLGAFDRAWLAPGSACPDFAVHADVDERTVQTGIAYAAGFAPGCAVQVSHLQAGPDRLFSPLDGGVPGFDADMAKAAMLQSAGGDLQAVVAAHKALFTMMQSVLAPGGSTFLHAKAGIVLKGAGRMPEVTGPVKLGASGAEDFLLEYLDDKPMDQVAWGRAGQDEILELLALHPLAYQVTAQPAYIAKATAGGMAHAILAGLTGGPAVQILVGHDTNQADLAALLGLHWTLGGYPADDPPPGGGIMFTLLRDGAGAEYVTATYQVQTPREIRNLTVLDASNPPARQALPIPGCGDSATPTACRLPAFRALVGRLD
ncbi:MAG: hypothetical protein POH28_08775 [Acidocella sp.]|nr:hypothetical protein [Acidocella sp.]